MDAEQDFLGEMVDAPQGLPGWETVEDAPVVAESDLPDF